MSRYSPATHNLLWNLLKEKAEKAKSYSKWYPASKNPPNEGAYLVKFEENEDPAVIWHSITSKGHFWSTMYTPKYWAKPILDEHSK